MNEQERDLFSELQTVARSHDLQCRAILNIEGGRGWINYSKIEENDYLIQISTPDNFDIYKAARDDISLIFRKYGAVLAVEKDYKKRAFGFQKELVYMDREKFDATKAEQEELLKTIGGSTIGTQINGDVNTGGGILNTGNAETIDNRTTNNDSSDEKWFQKEVVKMILSFAGGVGATVAAQWIMRLIGWIS